jgi:hypothetical protein
MAKVVATCRNYSTGTELSTMALCATHEVIHCRGDSDAHNELMILETEDTRWRLSIQTSETLRNFAWSQSHPTAQSTFYMVERHDTHCMVTNTDTWYSVNCTTGEVTQCPRAVPSYLYDSRTTNVFTPADGYVVANGSIFYDGALLWNDALFQVRQIIAFEQDVMVTVGFYACQTTLVVLHIDPNTRHVVVRHHAEISRPDALIVGDKTVVYETKAGPQCYHWIKNRTVAIDTANARRMFFPTNTKTHLGLRYAQHITLIPLEIEIKAPNGTN